MKAKKLFICLLLLMVIFPTIVSATSINAVTQCRNDAWYGGSDFIKCEEFQRLCEASNRQYILIERSVILPLDDVACLHMPIDPSTLDGEDIIVSRNSCSTLVDCFSLVSVCRASGGLETYTRGDTEVTCRRVSGSPIVTPTITVPAGPPTVYGPFTPLVGIPGLDGNVDDFGAYINALYVLSISLAALLAVIKIIIAGVKWMLTDVVTTKQDAKNDIQGALVGLLIVISAVLVLQFINPALVKTDLLLQDAGGPGGGGGGDGGENTITAADCTIPAGQSNCNTSVSWSTTGLTAPSIRKNNDQFSTNPSSTNFPIQLDNGRNSFTIYDGTTHIKTHNANATCATDSGWDGFTDTCVSSGGASGEMSADVNSCTIPVGGSSCTSNITISWNTDGATSPLVENNGLRVSQPGTSGTVQTSSINPGNNRFNLRNNDSVTGDILSYVIIRVTCADSSSWNGSTCQ